MSLHLRHASSYSIVPTVLICLLFPTVFLQDFTHSQQRYTHLLYPLVFDKLTPPTTTHPLQSSKPPSPKSYYSQTPHKHRYILPRSNRSIRLNLPLPSQLHNLHSLLHTPQIPHPSDILLKSPNLHDVNNLDNVVLVLQRQYSHRRQIRGIESNSNVTAILTFPLTPSSTERIRPIPWCPPIWGNMMLVML